jgi:hypothetical protein
LCFFSFSNLIPSQQKSVSTVLKSKQQTSDELDRLTTEFGAFFGPIFHSNLMKLRNQASMAAQAAAASTTHKTTLINPQQVFNIFS